MTIVALDESGHEVAHSKGSADVLLPLCADYETDAGRRELDAETRRTILGEAERMSSKALRVLAVAKRDLGRRSRSTPPIEDAAGRRSVDIEDRLTFLGLVGMIDPPRDGVKRGRRAAAPRRSVRAVMITGDHKLTAVAIAQELGLWDERAIALTGTELEKMSDDDARAAASRTCASSPG